MTNTTQAQEKKYMRFDLQDIVEGMDIMDIEHEVETFEEMKEWLADFWAGNPNQDDTKEEIEQRTKEIMAITDESELDDRLGGIDYSFYELDQNGQAIIMPQCTCEQDAKSQEKFFTDHGACQVCVFIGA